MHSFSSKYLFLAKAIAAKGLFQLIKIDSWPRLCLPRLLLGCRLMLLLFDRAQFDNVQAAAASVVCILSAINAYCSLGLQQEAKIMSQNDFFHASVFDILVIIKMLSRFSCLLTSAFQTLELGNYDCVWLVKTPKTKLFLLILSSI